MRAPCYFVVPRISDDETTIAVVAVRLTASGVWNGLSTRGVFLSHLRHAVTRWAEETKRGKLAWNKSAFTLNIGDLSNEDLAPIIARLDGHVVDMEIECYVDPSPRRIDWTYDTVLVDRAKR